MRLSGTIFGASTAIVALVVFNFTSFAANEDEYKSRFSVLHDETAELPQNRLADTRGAKSDLWAIPQVTNPKPLAVATLKSAEEVVQPAAVVAPERVTTRRYRPKRKAPRTPTWVERFLQGR